MRAVARAGGPAVVTAALLLATTACSGGSSDEHGQGAARARPAADTRGAVPIPTAPTADPTASAAPRRPAVLEMGAPVEVRLAGGRRVVLTALGPEQGTTRPGADSTSGTFRVHVAPRTGSLRVDAADFSSRNETGRVVPLTARGAASVLATPARHRVLTLVGRYASGAAQVSYRHGRALVAVWDFNVELD